MKDPLLAELDRDYPHLDQILLQSYTGELLRLTKRGPQSTFLELISPEGRIIKQEEVKTPFNDLVNSFLSRWRLVGHVLDYEVVEAVAILRDAMHLKERVLRMALEATPDLVDYLTRLGRAIHERS